MRSSADGLMLGSADQQLQSLSYLLTVYKNKSILLKSIHMHDGTAVIRWLAVTYTESLRPSGCDSLLPSLRCWMNGSKERAVVKSANGLEPTNA